MLGLKLNHVGKRGPRSPRGHWVNVWSNNVHPTPTPVRTHKRKEYKLEQLERLRSEETPTPTPTPPPHDYPYHWVILHPKKTKSKLQIWGIRQDFEFLHFETNITRDTLSEVAWSDAQIWNWSDEYCWRYRADTILSTDGQTRRHGQTHWRTRWNQYTPPPLSTSLKRWV